MDLQCYELYKLRKPELLLSGKTMCAFWTYAVYNAYNELLFVWYGRLNDIVGSRPFRSLNCYDPSQMYKVYLLGCVNTEIEARNEVNWWIEHSELHGRTPLWNMNFRIYNDNKLIRCLETGELFRNAQEIVKTYGVCQSALSKHLAQKAGYKTVKGMRFVYCDENVTYEDYCAQHVDTPVKQGEVTHTLPQLTSEQVKAAIGDYGSETPVPYKDGGVA